MGMDLKTTFLKAKVGSDLVSGCNTTIISVLEPRLPSPLSNHISGVYCSSEWVPDYVRGWDYLTAISAGWIPTATLTSANIGDWFYSLCVPFFLNSRCMRGDRSMPSVASSGSKLTGSISEWRSRLQHLLSAMMKLSFPHRELLPVQTLCRGGLNLSTASISWSVHSVQKYPP